MQSLYIVMIAWAIARGMRLVTWKG